MAIDLVLAYASLIISISLILYANYVIARKISLYYPSYTLSRVLKLALENGNLAKIFREAVLQKRFISWGGEVAVEGIFRGISLAMYMLILILSIVNLAYFIASGRYFSILSILISIFGAVLFVAGAVIVYRMRVPKHGRTWLMEVRGLDLLYLVLLAILGLAAAPSFSEAAAPIAIPLSALLGSVLVLMLPYTRFWYNIAFILRLLTYQERHPGKLLTPFRLDQLTESDIESLKLGIERFGDIETERLINLDSCANCGLCDSVCPAYAVDRPLSPRRLVLALRSHARSDPDKTVVDLIEDDTFWACTTCGACVAICPMGVDHVPFIVDVRRYLVFSSRLDQKKNDLIMSIAQYENAMGIPNSERLDRMRKLGVPLVEDGVEFEYLLWVGCMGSFDDRASRIVAAFVEILKKAGLKVAVLGGHETCCGDPMRRLGEESRYQDLALRNIEIFKQFGVKKIITICPHGYNTFKNEYRDLDDSWDVEVYHHSEILARLIKEGKIRPEAKSSSYSDVGIHDSCYIGRINNMVEEPRVVLRVSSKNYIEPERRGRATFCCGAGGANYWYDVPERKRISVERIEELLNKGARVIATECPFCAAMFEDALRNIGKDKEVAVRDLAEILYDSIR